MHCFCPYLLTLTSLFSLYAYTAHAVLEGIPSIGWSDKAPTQIRVQTKLHSSNITTRSMKNASDLPQPSRNTGSLQYIFFRANKIYRGGLGFAYIYIYYKYL